MSSSNKTSYLGLNQWTGDDKPKREDFNSDNEKVDLAYKLLSQGTFDVSRIELSTKSGISVDTGREFACYKHANGMVILVGRLYKASGFGIGVTTEIATLPSGCAPSYRQARPASYDGYIGNENIISCGIISINTNGDIVFTSSGNSESLTYVSFEVSYFGI